MKKKKTKGGPHHWLGMLFTFKLVGFGNDDPFALGTRFPFVDASFGSRNGLVISPIGDFRAIRAAFRLFDEGHRNGDDAALGVCLELLDAEPPSNLHRLLPPQVPLLFLSND
jgi:hypothetical protein